MGFAVSCLAKIIGKWILIVGVVVVLVRAVIWLVESLGLPLGRLPGKSTPTRG
jgi:hypothetical protein